MNFSAVILAGGKSSRMGRDKAFVEIGRQTLLARQLQLVREVGAAEIFISGRVGVDYSSFGCRVLTDPLLEAGPLAGIESALAAMTTPLLLVLAVDLPNMDANFLRDLLAKSVGDIGIIPRVAGQMEPLAAKYPRRAHPLAVAGLRAGKLAVRDFVRACVADKLVTVMDFSSETAAWFQNCNSPADLPTA